ncbi:hypothetical protein [Phocaeicola sartorii]|uniref:hypothetical protein n=1 Tax=Phocaeicola sartorii TaxID=671267 RepID=UPI00242E7243|nr:hypothetical protein [Phocaeicola sartorii]
MLPLLPPFSLKPPWTGRFEGWWQHILLCAEKGCCHHFFCSFRQYDTFQLFFQSWRKRLLMRMICLIRPHERVHGQGVSIGFVRLELQFRRVETTVPSELKLWFRQS